ncbi:unnamed protein product [Nesidiocoris tenuis]|uniref:Peptidase S8/S53 domain-containing protein n=1 Tax=Nesidiocoris tenuis TaxID=355587 RepID=A0A6H5GSL6_9HEMI|nr:unnamed protein product [Nesidiocoris tenuis]
MQAVLGLLFASCSFVLSLNKYHGDNIWVATVDGGPDVAKKIAEKHRFEYVGQVSWIEYQEPKAKSIRGVYPSMYSWMESKYRLEFNDALWYKQWYLQDYRPDVKKFVLDMNVVPCYREGITGKGVRVTVVDDGVEKDHADLRNNFDPQISFDYVMNRTDPTPPRSSASHGTQCAGVIAMVANNSLCGVGIAFNAQIGGVRLLDGGPSDLLDGQALSHRPEKVDIYSCSWGPPDDGETMEGPGRVARRAMLNGILKGRDGKGSIYVFAGGNAKMKGDNCGADGYVNSMFTIAIASAMQEGRPTFYSERCSAIMATAYSSGSIRAEQVTRSRWECKIHRGDTGCKDEHCSRTLLLDVFEKCPGDQGPMRTCVETFKRSRHFSVKVPYTYTNHYLKTSLDRSRTSLDSSRTFSEGSRTFKKVPEHPRTFQTFKINKKYSRTFLDSSVGDFSVKVPGHRTCIVQEQSGTFQNVQEHS